MLFLLNSVKQRDNGQIFLFYLSNKLLKNSILNQINCVNDYENKYVLRAEILTRSPPLCPIDYRRPSFLIILFELQSAQKHTQKITTITFLSNHTIYNIGSKFYTVVPALQQFRHHNNNGTITTTKIIT